MIIGSINFGMVSSPFITLVYAATLVPDLNLGNCFSITLGGALTVSNPVYGGNAVPQDNTPLLFRFIQDGTGSRVLTFGSQFTLGATVTSYTLSTTAAKVDYIGCLYRKASTKWDIVSVVLGY